MPFDGNTGRDLSVPSLETLRFVILHPEDWPVDFHWDYRDSNYCAIGLSRRLWGKNIVPVEAGFRAGVRPWIGWLFGDRAFADIKPRHVARAIDRYLARA